MTTDGSNGAPESAAKDDPFAYLYRPAEGESVPDTTPVPGQPRTSYARPMEVGRAQYGQQPRPPYGQQPPTSPTQQVPQQQQPNRYAEHSRPQPGEERSSGGRGKAAVIGVVAVIAAVAIGGGIALSGGDAGKSNDGAKPANSHSAPAGQSASPSAGASSAAPSVPPPSTDTTADASKLQGSAPSGNGIKNAISADGSYRTLQGGAGSTIVWTISVQTAGPYKFWLHYNNPGADVPATVTINGEKFAGGLMNLKNYTHSSDPDQAWTTSNIWPDLQAGPTTFAVSVPDGVNIAVDQVAITPRSVGEYPKK